MGVKEINAVSWNSESGSGSGSSGKKLQVYTFLISVTSDIFNTKHCHKNNYKNWMREENGKWNWPESKIQSRVKDDYLWAYLYNTGKNFNYAVKVKIVELNNFPHLFQQ